jgi:SpoVK/Ycf46/Vps4 family AAA+-type ATPase
MATAQQVKALLKSYSEGNAEHFVSVALQIAAHAARTGKGHLAQDLRDLVDEIKRRQESGRIGGSVPIARPQGELAGLLIATYPATRFSEMVLAGPTAKALGRVVREFRSQEKLRSHGLSARRKLLLIGPPGCGKTMTASALAGELKLPLFSVQLHALITKYMGETAAKLHQIFDVMTTVRGIYFFDEFDAIGADRGTKNDVGEIRRVLNSFLQFLEQDDSDSLILAATNYVAMLDEALFRRFDDVVRYNRPDEKQTEQLIRNHLQSFLDKQSNWSSICDAAIGLSHSEIARACDDAAKDYILGDRDKVDTHILVETLKERHHFVTSASPDGR